MFHQELPSDEANRCSHKSCLAVVQTSRNNLHLLENVSVIDGLLIHFSIGSTWQCKVQLVEVLTEPGL